MKKRVLIVDNEPHIREVTQLALELVAGWQVLTAGSGQEAIATATVEHPDAILLDVMMPDMDGLTTFGKLQEDPATKPIPVILLTAQIQQSDRTTTNPWGFAMPSPSPSTRSTWPRKLPPPSAGTQWPKPSA